LVRLTEATHEHPTHAAAAALYRNFVVMALCFSANHGAVTAVIALASSFGDTNLGSYSVGVLYSVYVLTATFGGSSVIRRWSTKGKAPSSLLGTSCTFVSACSCVGAHFFGSGSSSPSMSPGAMVRGLFLFVVYVACYLAAVAWPRAAWAAILVKLALWSP
jgi:hypothetical protein